MAHPQKSHINCYIFAIGICLLVGLCASWFAQQGLHDWYPQLKKPSFTPPNWVFPVAGTVFYVMMGWAWATLLSKEIPAANKLLLSSLFGFQLLLNLLWSVFFFYLRNPFLAMFDLIFLWGAIAFTILVFSSYSRLAAHLLLPYWVSVFLVWILNVKIWALNS